MLQRGNNEGITLTKNQLKHLYDDADFDVICANLREVGTQEPFLNRTQLKKQTELRLALSLRLLSLHLSIWLWTGKLKVHLKESKNIYRNLNLKWMSSL